MKHYKAIASTSLIAVKAAVIGLASLMPFQATLAEDFQGHISGMIGKSDLKTSDWGQHDLQGVTGILIDFKKPSWPVSVAIDLVGSGDEDDGTSHKKETYSAAIQLGVRKIIIVENSVFKPYLGAGVTFINSEMRETNNSTQLTKIEEDSAVGAWVGVGTYVELSEHFHMGADLRYSEADVTLFNAKRKAGGVQTVVSMGYHW